MNVECLDAREISQADALAIGELLATVWPKPGKDAAYRAKQLLESGSEYAGPDAQCPRSFVLREEGVVIAHSGIITRTISTTAGDLTIAGLARVCTDPTQRGRGLGEAIVRPALATVDAGDFPFALFQTSPEVRPFYEKQGAVVVDNEVINSLGDDLSVCPFWDEVIMRYPGTGNWPEGTIDLRGPGY